MSDKIAKVEREIARVESPSLDEVLGEPAAIVKRGAKSDKTSRILPGKHIAHLHTIRYLKDHKSYPLIAFEMTIVRSRTMVVGQEVFYVCTIRGDVSMVVQHFKNLELKPDILSNTDPTVVDVMIDVECSPTISSRGKPYNVISMWKKK